MKKIFLLCIACFMSCFFQSAVLFAQDKTIDFDIKKKYKPLELVECGPDAFYLVCEESISHNLLSKGLFKFDANLNPVWPEPVVLKSPFSMLGGFSSMNLKVFAFKDPNNGDVTDFILRDNDVFQVMPDGEPRQLDTGISEKEMRKMAAAFTDANGLNIITLTGNKDFLSGSMNWYVVAPGTATPQKRTITLPLPSGIDKKNNSGWRLNEVSASGLYFYYVSFKNDLKDQSRPILLCHVIQVGPDGKAGNPVTLDPGLEKYTAMTVDFRQDEYPNLIVEEPACYETGLNGGGSWYHIPTDNAYMGIKIDAVASRIYAVTAQNEALKMDKDGTVNTDALGRAQPVKLLELTIFDLTGKKTAQTQLMHTPASLSPSDSHHYLANQVSIFPLPTQEGVGLKLLNNGDGVVWLMNPQGEQVNEIKIQPYTYREKTVRHYYDIFASAYFSLSDFNNAPYAAKEKSPVVQYFNKMEEKLKRDAYYLSLKDAEILASWDEKNHSMKLNAFKKGE